jgi:hypothetical protein
VAARALDLALGLRDLLPGRAIGLDHQKQPIHKRGNAQHLAALKHWRAVEQNIVEAVSQPVDALAAISLTAAVEVDATTSSTS